MKKHRRSLPPLDYLLFFEAVARQGNFTRAAEELNVSQATVSKRVKVLEGLLGFSLVHRQGRHINFAPEWLKIANKTSEALDHLEKCLIQLQAVAHIGLKLASNVAVSQFWLTPRINEYLLRSNPAPITSTASDKDSDLINHENDAVIYYGEDIPKGWEGNLLFKEVWLPLAAPDLLTLKSELSSNILLDFEKMTPKWVNWSDLADRSGISELSKAQRINLGSYANTVYAAIKGKGLALGCPDVLKNEIESERLVPLYDFQIKTERSYFVIWRNGTMTQQRQSLLNDIGILSQ